MVATARDIVPLQMSPEFERGAVRHHFAPNQDLFLQGDDPIEVHALLTGWTKLWRLNERGTASTLLMLGRGEILGSIAVIQHTTNPVTATAINPVTSLAWPASVFRDAVGHSAELSASVLRVIARRAAQLVDRFDDVVGLPVEARLARLLLRLAGETGKREDGFILRLDVRQQDLAEMCATTVPTVSRTLATWRRDGLVSASRGHLRLAHLPRLAEIAGLQLD
jgi:CRP/FNR family transcriptional regulator, nitrogen oxide reductase regulator